MHPAGIPFSVEVSSATWRREAEAWAAETVAALDGRVLAVTQPRVRPWSTQLVIEAETPAGRSRFWFKANCPAQSFEPALHSFIAELLPDAAAAPIATEQERGWMISADLGATLREARGDAGATVDDWLTVVDEWTRVQHALTTHAVDVTALGVPDCSPATVPERFERMLERVLALPPSHPSAPDPATAAALLGSRSRVATAAAELVSSDLPSTLQHGDLHPGNVFAAAPGEPGRLRVFDFGDAQWAHPVEAVLIPMAVMEYGGLDPAPVVGAFRDAWSVVAGFDDADWAALTAAAEVSQAVNRAFTWWDCLADADDEEIGEWGEAVLRHLTRVTGRDDGSA
ncbi:hypothetical protein JOE59_001797 [Agromyces cerinus]|uniref:phosphotransferase family protein n=1 Tax=Agromyces cerinus TaxID=33878 RepID=UPI001957E952|nr:phosphotransferase [Agromyces cerinus]MBM7831092.1 hypothetical protein [Agromyces cerinus]